MAPRCFLIGLLVLWAGSTAAVAQSPSVVSQGGSAFDAGAFFVENRGQLDVDGARLGARRGDYEVAFAQGRVLFNLIDRGAPNDDGLAPQVGGSLVVLHLGNARAEPLGEALHPSYSNFFRGDDPAGWRTRVPHYGAVRFPDAFEGVDLVYRFDARGRLKYDLVVHPGADPGAIVFRYEGVSRLTVAGDGSMRVESGAHALVEHPPVSYQIGGGASREVRSAFVPVGEHGFAVRPIEDFDRTLPLVIDPTVTIGYATYFGSGGANNRTAAVDSSGNVYMAGGTSSSSWPTTPGAYDTTHSGGSWPDASVAKFDPGGNLLWSTFLGGGSEDYAYVSAVNAAGELFVAGRAGMGFPTTAGAYDRTFNGGTPNGTVHDPTDAFVARIASDGASLIYSTFVGGSGNDNGRAIHLGSDDEVIVGGGNSTSPNLPATPGVLKPALGGVKDAWVCRLSADGSTLRYLTYFGPSNDNTSNGDEIIRALGEDSSGNVWIGGSTATGTDMTPTPDAFQSVRGAGSESFIAKISPDATALLYFSWLGGNGHDAIETEGPSDSAGNFYVAGSSASDDFPTSAGAFQSSLRGGGGGAFDGDGFIARIDDDGSLGFATLYGSSTAGPESCFGPAVDAAGNVYVSGRFRTSTDTHLVTPDGYQMTPAGAQDAVLAVFSPDGTELLHGTYYGGSGTEHGRFVAIAPDDSAVYILGETSSTDLPLESAYQSAPAGAFLVKFELDFGGSGADGGVASDGGVTPPDGGGGFDGAIPGDAGRPDGAAGDASAPGGSTSDGGCGCSVMGSGAPRASLWLLAFGLVVRRRQRARQRRHRKSPARRSLQA